MLHWAQSKSIKARHAQGQRISSLRIIVDDSQDVRSNFLRVGLGGERIGNCAIFYSCFGPTGTAQIGLWPVIENVEIRARVGSGTNGACALFLPDPINGLQMDDFISIGTSYGIIQGISDNSHREWNVQHTTIDAAGNLIQAPNHGFSNGKKVFLIYEENLGTFEVITPRTQYYVVNATTSTFQIAQTVGGTPLSLAVASGAPDPYVTYSGSHQVEFAPDCYVFGRMVIRSREVGIVLANCYQSQFDVLEMQSNRVSMRLLNLPSSNRQAGTGCAFGNIYIEGSLDSSWPDGLEYWRIEWNYCTFRQSPELRGINSERALISGSGNIFEKPIFVNSDRHLKVSGDTNRMVVRVENYEAVTDTGSGNIIHMDRGISGIFAKNFRRNLLPTQINREVGGYYPDFAKQSAVDAGEVYDWKGDGSNLYVAADQLYYNEPSDLKYLQGDGHFNRYIQISLANASSLIIRNPLGSMLQDLLAGEFFPKSRFMVVARCRASDPSVQVRLNFQRLGGSGIIPSSGYKELSGLPSTWVLRTLEVNAKGASDDATLQLFFSKISTSGTFDLDWLMIVPFAQSLPAEKINFGQGVEIKRNGSTLNVSALPTSASGLISGDLWNDAGAIKIVS